MTLMTLVPNRHRYYQYVHRKVEYIEHNKLYSHSESNVAVRFDVEI